MGSDDKVSVEFLPTGTCWMREPMSGQPITNAFVPFRMLRSFTGPWLGPLPVGAFLIRHPAGPILFDTGISTKCNEPGYFPCWNPIPGILNKFDVAPEDAIINRLAERGVKPTELQAIIVSHLHHDHAGGLKELAAAAPEVPIYVGGEHWDADPFTAFESLKKIKEYARQTDIVVLPTHDPDTPRLLRERVVYRPKDEVKE
ncbi:N-acyl homoserine lactonase [Colletotrichum sp. SAR11_239]|nr:N-acyl homoserine lactonase [Colletotrichum sp. SAR11_239]